mgnify:CR=1 FL=1
MTTISSLLILGAIILMCYALLKILSAPIRLIFKLLINTCLGFVVLFIVSFFGEFFGISIGVNFFNALITGFLGIPGVALLIILNILF